MPEWVCASYISKKLVYLIYNLMKTQSLTFFQGSLVKSGEGGCAVTHSSDKQNNEGKLIKGKIGSQKMHWCN